MYARAQGNHSKWTVSDYQHKGYGKHISGSITEQQLLLLALYILLLTLITTILIKMAPKLYQGIASQTHRGNQYYSFFWAAVLVASIYNTLVLIYQIIALIKFKLLYFIIVWVLLFLDLLIATCIPKSSAFPIPRGLNMISYALCCTYGCSHNFRSKFLQTLAVGNILLFVQYFTISALPSILWVFVLPIRTLSVAALLYATLFCATALIALLIKNIHLLKKTNSWKQRCGIFLPLISLVLFMATMILSSFLYIKFIVTGIEVNSIGGFIVSFVPSAALTVIGWFITTRGQLLDKLFSTEDTTESAMDNETDTTTENTAETTGDVLFQMEEDNNNGPHQMEEDNNNGPQTETQM